MGKKKELTDVQVHVVLDRSGSMGGEHWTTAIGSLNEYVAELKKNKVPGTVNVTAFDSIYNSSAPLCYGDRTILTEMVDCNINKWKKLDHDGEVTPRGGTPLYDAAATVMNNALEDDNPIVVIITDGHENASKEYNQEQVKKLTEKVTKKGGEVIFLGANFDVAEYTQSAGLASTKFRNVDLGDHHQTTMMVKDLASNTVAYSNARAVGDASYQMDMSGDVEVNVKVKKK